MSRISVVDVSCAVTGAAIATMRLPVVRRANRSRHVPVGQRRWIARPSGLRLSSRSSKLHKKRSSKERHKTCYANLICGLRPAPETRPLGR